MECQEIDEQRKEERMRPKMRELDELPSTEIVESRTFSRTVLLVGKI